MGFADIAMICPVKIVWDEPKRMANLAKHRLDFADLTVAFFEAATVVTVKQGRLAAVGRLPDAITVIFVTLGTEAVSVISMRPASAKEARLLE